MIIKYYFVTIAIDGSLFLIWNPQHYPFLELREKVTEISKDGFTTLKWNCGNNKTIEKGDRIFIIRLGKLPKGIFGEGIVIRDRYEDYNYREPRNKLIGYVDVKLTRLYHPENGAILPLAYLKTEYDSMHWSSQVSGISIPNDIAGSIHTDMQKISHFNKY